MTGLLTKSVPIKCNLFGLMDLAKNTTEESASILGCDLADLIFLTPDNRPLPGGRRSPNRCVLIPNHTGSRVLRNRSCSAELGVLTHCRTSRRIPPPRFLPTLPTPSLRMSIPFFDYRIFGCHEVSLRAELDLFGRSDLRRIADPQMGRIAARMPDTLFWRKVMLHVGPECKR